MRLLTFLWLLASGLAISQSDIHNTISVWRRPSFWVEMKHKICYLYLQDRIVMIIQSIMHLFAVLAILSNLQKDLAPGSSLRSILLPVVDVLLSHVIMMLLCLLSSILGIDKLPFLSRFFSFLVLLSDTAVQPNTDSNNTYADIWSIHVALILCNLFAAVFGVGYYSEIKLSELTDNQAITSLKKDKPLSIVILTIGTRGDVQPFLSFGCSLKQKFQNSKVTVCTFSKYKSFVEQYGLDFNDTGFEELEQDGEKWLKATHISEVMVELLAKMTSKYVDLGKAFLKSCTDNDADLIIATSVTISFGLNIKEKINKPCWIIKFAPDLPTRAFPPSGDFLPPNVNIGLLNLLRWYIHWIRIGISAVKSTMSKEENIFRTEVLGLKSLQGGQRVKEMGDIPTICAYSNKIIPKPQDYKTNIVTTGFWFIDGNKNNLNEQTLLFVQSDKAYKATICVTFGSMSKPADSFLLVENVIVAIHAHFFPSIFQNRPDYRIRVLIIKSDVSQSLKKIMNDYKSTIDFVVVGEAPHEIVFPKCDAIVHHGGAGTTARAIQCGVPSVIIPVLQWTDQPFWADQLVRLGVGIHVPRHTTLAMDNAFQKELVNGFGLVFSEKQPTMKEITLKLCNSMESSGVDNAISLIDKFGLSVD